MSQYFGDCISENQIFLRFEVSGKCFLPLQGNVGVPIVSVSVSYLYLRYFSKISILLYLSDTGVVYLEYLTEDTFQSIFPNPAIWQCQLR